MLLLPVRKNNFAISYNYNVFLVVLILAFVVVVGTIVVVIFFFKLRKAEKKIKRGRKEYQEFKFKDIKEAHKEVSKSK